MQYSNSSYKNMVDAAKYKDKDAMTDAVMYEISQLVLNRPVAVADALKISSINVSSTPSSSELIDKILDNVDNDILKGELTKLIAMRYGAKVSEQHLNAEGLGEILQGLFKTGAGAGAGAASGGGVGAIVGAVSGAVDSTFSYLSNVQTTKQQKELLKQQLLAQTFEQKKRRSRILFGTLAFVGLALTALVIYKLKKSK